MENNNKRIVLVRYTLEVPVDMTGWKDESIKFDIEENSCLNTHNAGLSFDKIYNNLSNGCWACTCKCEAEIIDMDWKPEGDNILYNIITKS